MTNSGEVSTWFENDRWRMWGGVVYKDYCVRVGKVT